MTSLPFLYTTVDSVKVRLAGKVQFQSSPDFIQGELPDALLIQLIQDAESDVELALNGRYFTPFQRTDGAPFGLLPDHTIRQIRKVVDYRAVELIMATDFGRGTHVNAEEYDKETVSLYDKGIADLLGKNSSGNPGAGKDRFRLSPPLPELRLALSNQQDNGLFGTIINTDASRHDSASYAEEQTNDPSRNYIKRGARGGGTVL